MSESQVDPTSALGVLWGKSDAGGRMNLLLQHLLDAAATAEQIWDHFLAPTVTHKVNACCDGQGRLLFSLLCGLHDVGKASPAFQAKVPELAAPLRQAGLTWRELDRASQRWHHSWAGASVVRRCLPAAGWDKAAVDWVWPLVAGHHGEVPSVGKIHEAPENAQGVGAWVDVQDALVSRVAVELGIDLATIAPSRPPRRATQLTIAGLVIMADWIASDVKHFSGVDSLPEVSIATARERAEKAWLALNLRGGWSPSRLLVQKDPIASRFGVTARPAQLDAVAVAESMPAPGLLILEAPMGEGKTEAALACVEVLARKFGADGVFVGMPTQATSDPMFSRVRKWLTAVQPDVGVGLLHGRARFNPEWNKLRRQVDIEGVDEHGCHDPYASTSAATATPNADVPAEWFFGPKRGLLAPVTVGTVDQLLHAATRTRHVMLRQAGLGGRVVVLDEVHAYDVYMAQFLFEALRWLADAGVPVVLLSATLPPSMRKDLFRAYLQGALSKRDVDLDSLSSVDGYPTTQSVCVVDGTTQFEVRPSRTWRPSSTVHVEVLDESPAGEPDRVIGLLRDALEDGGCALVVRNTVGRAQQTYLAAKEAFGDDVVLLHARLTAGARAERTKRVLDLLGANGSDGRPHRLVVVATQLAEQSFDIDADLLVSDLAPADLLLQRVGRLHRHDRPVTQRPERVRSPRLVVTGLSRQADGPPEFPRGSEYVYGRHLLLRTAAQVIQATSSGWDVPRQVPALVAAAYADTDLVPVSWADVAQLADEQWRIEQARRESNAKPFLLSREDDLGAPTLADLHERGTSELRDDDAVTAVVRDGERSVEVVLVRHGSRGYLTLDGEPLGPNGEAVDDDNVLDHVIQATIRLPARPQLYAAALSELRPLSGWTQDPWLRRTRALILDDAMSAPLGGRLLTYHHDLGLTDEAATVSAGRTPRGRGQR